MHGDDRISFAVTRPMPMGQHAIELRTQRGVVRGPDALVVEREPLPLQAELRGVGAERGLVLSGRGPADCVVGVWLAPAVLPAPFDSGYGPWHLETDLTGQISGALRLDQLRLFAANGQTDHRGGWQIAIDLVEASSALGSDAVFAQAILADRFDPTLACFTAPVRVDLTR